MAKATAKFNIYQHVTDTILAQLEAGTVPWHQPWSGGVHLALPRRVTGEAYQGVNVVMLWCAALARGYTATTWMTYRQSREIGGQVRKGEKSSTVVKFGRMRKEGAPDPITDAHEEERHIAYARAYRVFNVEQIDGLEAHWYDTPEPPRDFGTDADPVLARWFGSMGIPITHGPDPRAYYLPAEDRINMPPVCTFESQHGYIHTLAHEVAHAVAAPKRLDLDFAGKTRTQRYAREEIYADLSSAMVCARLGVKPAFDQNAAYLASWIAALKADHRAIVKAASTAQAAADWMFETAGEPDGRAPADAGQGMGAEAA